MSKLERRGAPAPRIVHLDHTSTVGGAEFALVRMLRAGPPWTPVVLVPRGEPAGVFGALDGVAPVRTMGVRQPFGVSAAGPLSVIPAALSLAVQAAATRLHPAVRSADLVHANTARASAYGALAAWTLRKPFVVHLRDTVDTEALGTFGFEMMRKVVLPRADGVIANSAATLDAARPYLPGHTASVVIPSASGLHSGEPPVRIGAPLRVGMLARIDPWKGQSLVLEAFARAFAEGDELLELAGGTPFGHADHLDELRQRARTLGLADRVSFLGHVDDVTPLLVRWDIAVQASLRPEPLGQNVLQYLAAGCATVVADEGGPTEWVTDGANGLWFRTGDAESLARALRRLADDPALRARLALAAAHTPGLLDDAAVADAHGEFFRDVIARFARGGRRHR